MSAAANIYPIGIHASMASEDLVLAGMLQDAELAAYAVACEITPEHFTDQECKRIATLALAQFRQDGACTFRSVYAELAETDKEPDTVWWTDLLGILTERSEFSEHMRRMIRAKRLRDFSVNMQNVQRTVFDTAGMSLREREERMEAGIGEMMQYTATSESNLFLPAHLSAIAADVLAGKTQIFAPTGIKQFDMETKGFMPGRVTIIAARPSHGKTAFSIWLSILANMQWRKANERGQVLYFSAEMGERAMVDRLLSTLSGVSALTIASGQMNALERERVTAAAGRLGSEIRLTLDTHSSPTNAYMLGRALALNASEPVRLIVFDYLEYTGEQDQSKDLRLEKALQGCHELAKRIGCPVLVLSQLNRDLERRGKDARPQLADIRYTGAGENIAAMVLMLYHPWTHWKQRGSEGGFKDHEGNERSIDPAEPDERRYELLIRKNTHGPVGDLLIEFDRRTASYRDPFENMSSEGAPF